MKNLILILAFISLEAGAVTLSQNRSSNEGFSEQKFVLEKGKTSFEKRSNFFDKKKDFRLGTFSTNPKLSTKLKADLEDVSKTIRATDEFLKKRGKDFNSLTGQVHHRPYLMIDGFIVTEDSNQYKKLKDIFDRLQLQDWKQQSGVVLSKDFKTIEILENGKVKESEKFDFAFRCKSEKMPTVCGYKDLGILYVE